MQGTEKHQQILLPGEPHLTSQTKSLNPSQKWLVLGLFSSIMAGSQDLAGPGVGQVPKTATQSFDDFSLTM